MEIKCNSCHEIRKLVEYSYKNKTKGTRQRICKICTRSRIKTHYVNNKNYYITKAKKRNMKVRQVLRKYIWDYLLKHPCLDCGESDPVVLEFDHTREKIVNISSLVSNSGTISKFEEEVSRCEVRCANCHRRKTARDFGWYRLKYAPVA